MDLVLIRHALPVRIEGADGRADPELAERGVEQARAVAGFLADESFDALYSSPMRRAVQTAEAIAQRTGLAIQIVDDIAEYDRDSDSYIPIEEVRSSPDEELVEHWKALAEDRLEDISPEAADFRPRVARAMAEIVAAHPGQRVLAVCHGGVLNVYLAEVLEMKRSLWFQPDYASVSRVRVSRQGPRSLVSANETAHLRGLL